MFSNIFVPVAMLLLVSYSMSTPALPEVTLLSNIFSPAGMLKGLPRNDWVKTFYGNVGIQVENMCLRLRRKEESNTIARTATEKVMRCVQLIVGYDRELENKLMKEISNINDASTKEILLFIKDNCQPLMGISDCVNEFLIDTEPCTRSSPNDKFNKAIRDFGNAVLSFLCDNKDRNIDAFIDEGLQCFKPNIASNIKSCIPTYAPKAMKTQLQQKFDEDYILETCRASPTAIQCISEGMKNCSSSEMADLAESFLNQTVLPTCDTLQKSGNSKVNPLPYLIILSLIFFTTNLKNINIFFL